jgi:DNA-binding transcriptional LysR family regulator
LRSFTKAAQSLGVTQPAVSAQIKRLQFLLGTELLDKSAPGVALTSAGEIVVNYARRMLSINDQILDLAGPRFTAQTLRIGMTGDFAAPTIGPVLAQFRTEMPDVRFVFRSGTVDRLLRDLREGEVDVLVALSSGGPVPDARRSWTEPLVWVGTAQTRLDSKRPVPLVTYGEECLFHRTAIAALNQSGREFEMVLVSSTIAALCSALFAGLGVTVFPRSLFGKIPGLTVCDDKSLPGLSDGFCGVYVREGGGREIREQFADALADALQPEQRTLPQGHSKSVNPAA